MNDLLQTLVGFKTVTKDVIAVREALDFIDTYLSRRGMHARRFTFNGDESLWATIKPTKRPRVLLTGHIDVVPASPELFVMRKDGDRLSGRGTLDMKFAIACYLQLVDELKESIQEYDFGIMITSDEERGGFNGAHMLVEAGYTPTKVCIVPDSGYNWMLETMAKGVWHISITMPGKSAHGSRPWEGKSALIRLLSLLDAIKQTFPSAHLGPSSRATASVNKLHAGHAVNQIPAEATAALDIRTSSVADHYERKAIIERLCREHGAVLEEVADAMPCLNDRQDPHIKQFVDQVEATIGQPVHTTYSHAATDGRHFTYAGIPCVIIAPPGGDHHGPGEWVSQRGMEQFYEVLRRYIHNAARS